MPAGRGRLGRQDHLEVQFTSLRTSWKDAVVGQRVFILRKIAVSFIDDHVNRKTGVITQSETEDLLEQQGDNEVLTAFIIFQQRQVNHQGYGDCSGDEGTS